MFYDSATALNPMLKVGSAPLGIYDNMNKGDLLGSYNSVYQDSEGWILERKHDYLVPQVYWDIGSSPGDPDFSLVVGQWHQQENERHVYIGIGAYKPEIAKEVPTQIDVTRRYRAEGQAYFRYENIRNQGIFGNRYRTLANIPPMKWKDPVPPLAPGDLTVTEIEPDVFHLQWIPGERAADGDRARYYNIYRWTSENIPFNDPSAITAITSTDATAFFDTVVSPAGLKLFYAVSAFDKAHNESSPSNVATVVVKEMVELSRRLLHTTSLSAVVGRESGPTLVGYRLAEAGVASLDLLLDSPGQQETVVATLASGLHSEGTYVVGLDNLSLPPGKYILRLKTAALSMQESLQLHRR
jgi:hypothetical protein